MANITGFISRIDVKNTAYGPMYDIVMDDGKAYGLGKFAPKAYSAGDYVTFVADQKPGSKFWNIKAGSLSKQDKPAGVAPAPTSSAGRSGGYDDNRQERISKQWAINAALTYVNLLSTAGALPFGASTKTDKKADIIHTLVMETAQEFYHLGTGETYDMPDTGSDVDISGAETGDNWTEE